MTIEYLVMNIDQSDVSNETITASIIRTCKSAEVSNVDQLMPETVLEEDRERFIQLVIAEFQHLHAGNVVRFGFKPLEFAAWQENVKAQSIIQLR